MIEADPQNRQENVRYLAASQQFFSIAGRWRCGQLVIVVAVPAGLALWGAFQGQVVPMIAFAGFSCAILDVSVFEPKIAWHRYHAAQLAEYFDTRIVGGSPSRVRCCDMPSEEDIENCAELALRSAKLSERLRNWYTDRLMALREVPGQMLCQRISSTWDEQLRQDYLSILIGIATMACLALIGITAAKGWTVEHVITNILFPIVPAAVWFDRELAGQINARTRKQGLRRAIELLWAGMIQEAAISVPLQREVDAGQGMHFMYRATQPSVPWWLSSLRRAGQLRALRKTVDSYIDEAHRRGLTVDAAPAADIGHMER